MPTYPKEKFSILLKQIPDNIKEKIFCFSGHPYLCEEAAKQIISKFKQRGAIIEDVFGDEIGHISLKEKLISVSLFEEERVIWIKDLRDFSFLNPKTLAYLQPYLIITTSDAKIIPDFLKNQAFFIDFFIKPREQEKWQEQLIQAHLKKAKKEITPLAKAQLLAYTGFNLFALKNCLDMLINYIGERKVIEERDIARLLLPIKEEAAFSIGEKLIQHNTEVALHFLKNLLDQDLHPLIILSLFIKEWRRLFAGKILLEDKRLTFHKNCSYQEFLKTTYPAVKRKNPPILSNLHPYMLYTILKRAGQYSLQGLYSIHEKLLLTDSLIKSSPKNSVYYLEMLIFYWCKMLGG